MALSKFGTWNIRRIKMSDLTPQPQSSDAILGGKTPPPVTGAVLGGLEGAKQRLESQDLVTRSTALKDAFRYGDRGIDLAVQALSDRSEEFQRLARRLLRNHETGKQALLEPQPLNYFTTLADWRHEVYNPQVGIVDPENNAYVVQMTDNGRRWRRQEYNPYLSQFNALLKDPNSEQLQALVFQIQPLERGDQIGFFMASKAICRAKKKLPNLKALFVGENYRLQQEDCRSNLYVHKIDPLLEAFPKLEVLQIYGYLGVYRFKCEGLEHKALKTLIVETSDICIENAKSLCNMKLPNLEYFDLSLGDNSWDLRLGDNSWNEMAKAVRPVLFDNRPLA
jgi:hypothetical protein